MSTRMKTTAAALTGAVVLASGAYALGAQSGDGDATAKSQGKSAGASSAPARKLRRQAIRRGAFGRPGPPDLSAMATKLGVTTAQLQSALEALKSDMRDDFAQQLADALGIDVAKVKAALPAPPPGPGGRPPGPGGPPPGGPPP